MIFFRFIRLQLKRRKIKKKDLTYQRGLNFAKGLIEKEGLAHGREYLKNCTEQARDFGEFDSFDEGIEFVLNTYDEETENV